MELWKQPGWVCVAALILFIESSSDICPSNRAEGIYHFDEQFPRPAIPMGGRNDAKAISARGYLKSELIIPLATPTEVPSGTGTPKRHRRSHPRWIRTYGWVRHPSGLTIRHTIRECGGAGGISAVG